MQEALLDTDILSYYLRGDATVVTKVETYLENFSFLTLSLITCYEVLSGLEYKQATRQIQAFEQFLADCNVLNISEESVRLSAQVAGQLERQGQIIGNSDLLIAGIALTHDLTLVTNNERHFQRIPGLRIDNWKRAK